MPSQAMQDAMDALGDRQKASASKARLRGRRPCRAPSGGSPAGARRRQVGLPRFRRSAAPAVTPMPRAC